MGGRLAGRRGRHGPWQGGWHDRTGLRRPCRRCRAHEAGWYKNPGPTLLYVRYRNFRTGRIDKTVRSVPLTGLSGEYRRDTAPFYEPAPGLVASLMTCNRRCASACVRQAHGLGAGGRTRTPPVTAALWSHSNRDFKLPQLKARMLLVLALRASGPSDGCVVVLPRPGPGAHLDQAQVGRRGP